MNTFVKRSEARRSIAIITATVIFATVFSGCYSVQSGARDGVRDGVSQGVAGLFGGGKGGSSGDSSGGSSSGPERNYSGSTQTVPWPSDTEWGRYGVSGLKQPPNTDVTGAALFQGMYMVSLINGGRPAFDFLIAQIEKMDGADITTDVNTSDGKMVGYSTSTGSIDITVDLENGDILIRAYKF